MKSTTVVIDGNYYVHRAFSVAAQKKNPDYWEKNILTSFVSMVGSTAVHLKATHLLVCFDSPRTFRHDIYPKYKANRKKRDTTLVRLPSGQEVEIPGTPGSLVKPARRVLKSVGVATAYKTGKESDDLMAGAAASLPGRVIICARDKDLSAIVTDRVLQWWPIEKKLLGPKEVREKYGVDPGQIRDYLCLLGDDGDNIPGVPNIGPVTARRILNEHGSIANALKDKSVRKLLEPHKRTLIMAKKLVTLDTSSEFDLDALVPESIKVDEASSLLWSVPKSIRDLSDARKASKLKGLFK
jgi:DNA polymerase-1